LNTDRSIGNREVLQKLLSACKERTLVAFCLAVIIGVAFGSWRHDDISGMSPGTFWVMKSDWRQCTDVVLAGDSRTYRGLSPAAMGRHLPNMRILNYGFSSAGFSGAYLRRLEGVLASDNSRKILVLGITPHSLTEGAARKNGFLNHTKKSQLKKKMLRLFDPMFHFLRPVEAKEALAILTFGRFWTHYFEEYHRDGWVASSKDPENQAEALRAYSAVFDPGNSGTVSEDIINELIKTTAQWRGKGIEVYGFRMPTCRAMVEMETELARFDENAFVAGFEDAGGIWLSFDQTGYRTYDGSHLHSEGAKKLSSELSQKIRAIKPK
jgi:hypothetical protein